MTDRTFTFNDEQYMTLITCLALGAFHYEENPDPVLDALNVIAPESVPAVAKSIVSRKKRKP